MSSVVISGDTSGSVTLQAPATAGSTTLTLPATSGIVVATPTGSVSSGQLQTQVFYAPGTWTNPGTVTTVRVTVVSGGGGGGGGSTPTTGGRGGYAAYAQGFISSLPASPVAITVGSGGTGGATPNGAGASGGTSSFGSYISSTGGGAGSAPAVVGSTGTTTFTGATPFKDTNGGVVTTNFGGAVAISGAVSQAQNLPTALTYSATSPTIAGAYGNGASAGGANTGGGGTSGIIVVEFVA
jgi:hypothetical protein